MTIPAPLRAELGFDAGTTVVAYVENGRHVLERRTHVLNRLQRDVLAAAAGVRAGGSAVEELLVERRIAALRRKRVRDRVLDSSAVLTLLYREPGHEIVADLLEGALISAVNWSEIVQKLAQRGVLDSSGVGAGWLALGVKVVPFGQGTSKPLRPCGQRERRAACRLVIGRVSPSRSACRTHVR